MDTDISWLCERRDKHGQWHAVMVSSLAIDLIYPDRRFSFSTYLSDPVFHSTLPDYNLFSVLSNVRTLYKRPVGVPIASTIPPTDATLAALQFMEDESHHDAGWFLLDRLSDWDPRAAGWSHGEILTELLRDSVLRFHEVLVQTLADPRLQGCVIPHLEWSGERKSFFEAVLHPSAHAKMEMLYIHQNLLPPSEPSSHRIYIRYSN